MEEYFRLRDGDNKQLAEVHCPVDISGEPFPSFQRVDIGARAICHCIDGRTGLADCIHCVTDLIVSERAAEAFKRFLLPDGTQFLPVDVIAEDGRKLHAMVAVLFPELVTAVDLRASKYKELVHGIPWYFTEPPVVEAAALRGLDLLMCSWVLCVCSGRLRREIEMEELTNFAFEPVVLK